MTKRGAILLEILIAGAIASMLSVILLSAWMQMHRVQKQVDGMIEQTTRLQAVHHQLRKDLTSLTAPVIKPIKKTKQSNEEGAEKKSAKEGQEGGSAQQPKEDVDNKAEKQPELSYFVGIFDQDMTRRLSFISHNALHWYREGDRAVATPSLVRVVYTLKENPARKGSFDLFRQENTDLYESAPTGKQNNAAYLLVDGIKSFVVRYEYQQKDTKKEGEESLDKELQATNQWPLPKGDKNVPGIPLRVQVVIELWDSLYKKSEQFTLVYPLPVQIESTMHQSALPKEDIKPTGTASEQGKADTQMAQKPPVKEEKRL